MRWIILLALLIPSVVFGETTYNVSEDKKSVTVTRYRKGEIVRQETIVLEDLENNIVSIEKDYQKK